MLSDEEETVLLLNESECDGDGTEGILKGTEEAKKDRQALNALR